MPDPDAQRVICPHCGKAYRWQEKLVGRPVDCKKCDQRFQVPPAPGVGIDPNATAESESDDGLYDLATDDDGRTAADPDPQAMPAVNGKCPSCNSKVPESAVICLNCGFNMKEGTRVQTAVVKDTTDAADEPSTLSKQQSEQAERRAKSKEDFDTQAQVQMARQFRRTEYVFPIALLMAGLVVSGLVVGVIGQFYLQSSNASFIEIALGSAIYLILQTIGVMIAMIIAAFLLIMMYGSAFGELKSAMLKLPAIALAVAAVSVCIMLLFEIWLERQGFTGHSRQMGLVRMMIRLVTIYAIGYPTLRLLFDLDGLEASIICITVVVFSFAVALLGPVMLMGFFT